MRIRWTTRIAMAVGMITLVAGIVAGTGPVSGASAATGTTGHVAAAR